MAIANTADFGMIIGPNYENRRVALAALLMQYRAKEMDRQFFVLKRQKLPGTRPGEW